MRSLCEMMLAAALATLPAGSVPAQQAQFQKVGELRGPDALLEFPEVQKELKLSAEQIEKVNKVTHEVQQKHKEAFQKLQQLGPQERRQKQAEWMKTVSQETMRALSDVLEPRQTKRLEQIHLRQQGLKAFAEPKVEKALKLTADQKSSIRNIGDEAAKELSALLRGPQSNFQKAMAQIGRLRMKALEKSVALLTDDQKKVWQELAGEPFEVKSTAPLIRQPGGEPGKSPHNGKP